ncbi:MAG: MATE family efflux transporter [Oscillospiraceae bacterium]|nr:MATE family efflux transporter [Oscillospiraceae bacterium]
MIKINKIFATDKPFYKSVFKLVLPLIAMQAMFLILNFCDTIMLGRMDEEIAQTAISAAQIANRPFFLFGMLIFGSMSGATVLCSQYWGKKDIGTINSIAGTTLVFLLPISIIFTSICFIFTEKIMALLSNDPAIIELAAKYLRIMLVTFVLNAITSLFSGILRAVEKVIIPMIATLTGIVTNIILNAILIYGLLGFPAMGIRGAAVATVIARVVEMAIILIYIIFFEKTVKFTLKKMFKIHIIIIKDFFRYSIPTIINEFVWGFGTVIHSSIIGHMPKEEFGDPLAAYTISNLIEQIAFMTIIGFSTACCIIIGKAIGEGKDKETVEKYSRTFIGLAVLFSLITGGAAFISKSFIINIFNISGATKIYASQLFTVVTVFILLKTFNCVSIVGIFRGGGDTKTGMIIDSCSMYLLGIPLGFISMYFLKLDVAFVYMFLISDELFKLPVVLWRVKGGKWRRNITREKSEIER